MAFCSFAALCLKKEECPIPLCITGGEITKNTGEEKEETGMGRHERWSEKSRKGSRRLGMSLCSVSLFSQIAS